MDSSGRALLGIARGVLGELDLEAVLDRVVKAARELTGARYAALGVLDEHVCSRAKKPSPQRQALQP